MNIMNNAIEDIRRTDHGIIQGASHTCRVLNHKVRNDIIIKAVCNLRKITETFDSIACCGTSGLMVVPQIAEILKKNIVLIRKKGDKCYSEFSVEGAKPFRYVIVDDLICSGDTIKHIKKSIKNEYYKVECVGAYFYMPEECAYTLSKQFEKEYGMRLLNTKES